MAYKTVSRPAAAEFTEQRSRFLSFLFPVSSEAEAAALLQSHRQKYWDARHNVYAYRIAKGNIARFSDDGEPHSTAGKPTLDVLTGADLHNCLLITTRYFGGILLGTGGLVRAYTAAARLVVEQAEIVAVRECVKFRLNIRYALFDKLSAFLAARQVKILHTDFLELVQLQILLPAEEEAAFCAALREAFFDEIRPQLIERCSAAF